MLLFKYSWSHEMITSVLSTVCLCLFLTIGLSQDFSNRIYLSTGFLNTYFQITSTDTDEKYVQALRANDPRLEFGYEHYFSRHSGIAANIGYSNVSKNLRATISDAATDSLGSEGIEWNDFIRLPHHQHYLNLKLGYVYFPWVNDRNKLAISLTSNFRYGQKSQSNEWSNLFYQNENDPFQTFGPIWFESQIFYRQLIVNPNICIRYERLWKNKSSIGFSFDVNLPISKVYEGNIFILPEFEVFQSMFEFSSNGAFFGLSVFYGYGIDRRN